MIHNTKLINALRSLDFKFKRQADRVCIYKMKGNTKRVSVRRNEWHDEEYAAIILKQAGMSTEGILAFIRETSETRH